MTATEVVIDYLTGEPHDAEGLFEALAAVDQAKSAHLVECYVTQLGFGAVMSDDEANPRGFIVGLSRLDDGLLDEREEDDQPTRRFVAEAYTWFLAQVDWPAVVAAVRQP